MVNGNGAENQLITETVGKTYVLLIFAFSPIAPNLT